MNYRETYIKPKSKIVLETFITFVFVNIFLGVLSFLAYGYLYNDFWVVAKDTLFGDTYVWVIAWSVFAILSPIIIFTLWPVLWGIKYDKEWKKLKLIPYNPHKPNQPLFQPRPIDGKEPIWKENDVFKAKLKVIGHQLFPGYIKNEYIVVEDEAGIRYIVSGPAFDFMQYFKDEDGMICGYFTFNAKRRQNSILMSVTEKDKEYVERKKKEHSSLDQEKESYDVYSYDV